MGTVKGPAASLGQGRRDRDVLAVFEGDDGAGEPAGDHGVRARYGGEEELPPPGQAGHGSPRAARPRVGEGQTARFGVFRGGAGGQDCPSGVSRLAGERGLVIAAAPELDLDPAVSDLRGVLGSSERVHRGEELFFQQLQLRYGGGREHPAAFPVVSSAGSGGGGDPGYVGVGDDQTGLPVAGDGPGGVEGGGGHRAGLQVLS